MSFPRDLDEISTGELERELDRRRSLRKVGCCDYCGRKLASEPSCRFPDRHGASRASTTPKKHLIGRVERADDNGTVHIVLRTGQRVTIQMDPQVAKLSVNTAVTADEPLDEWLAKLGAHFSGDAAPAFTVGGMPE